MTAIIVPEFKVTDLQASLSFYTGLLPFSVAYARPEDGFAYLTLGEAALMLDQLEIGRSFETSRGPMSPPFGLGMNLEIELPSITDLLGRLTEAGWPLHLPQEDRWYRRDDHLTGNRQFVVADPDGYLLRFFEDLGTRPR